MVNFFVDVVRKINMIRKDIEWTMAVPESSEYLYWSEEELLKDGIKTIPILAVGGSETTGVKDGFVGLSHPFPGPRCFKFAASREYLKYDVVFSCYYTSQDVWALQPEYSDGTYFMVPTVEPPVIVNWLTETGVDRKLPKLSSRVGNICAASSILLSGATVVLSTLDLDEARRVLRSCASPALVKDSDIRVISPMVSVPFLDEKPHDKVVFVHGGTWEAKRNYQLMLDAVDTAYKSGLDVQLLLVTQGDASKAVFDLDKYSKIVKVIGSASRKDYLQALAEADFVLQCSEYEGTGLAMLEAIYSGITPIVLNKRWVDGRLPDDYPLLCKGGSTFINSVVACAKRPHFWKSKGREAVSYVRSMVDDQVYKVSKLLDDMLELRISRTIGRIGENNLWIKLLKDAVNDLGDEFTTEDVVKKIVVVSRNMKESLVRNYMIQLPVMIMTQGFVEVGGKWVRRQG